MEDLGYGGVVAGFADADFDPLLMSYHLAPGSPFSSLREAEGKEELKNAVGSKMGNFAMVQPLGYVMDLTDNESDDSWGAAAAGEKRQRGSRKRLSVYQVCCLEKWFKVDSKLEVRRKHQLAKELELKPRQVAIWFQNRRARHKKKQAEKEYGQIAEQYAMIKAQYDKVINENKKLKAQMKLIMEEMSLMEGSLLNYGKLMNAGLLNPRVMQQTQPELQQTFHNVCNGPGIIEQQVNSPVSSVFDSNSPVVTPKSQQLALADIWYPVAEPAEKTNTNFMQAEQENSVNQNLFDLDDHNCFYSSQVDAPPASPCDFGVIPDADDPLWQFEL